MSEKIENVYEFKTETGMLSYMYSLKKQEDYLGFDYYVLTKNEKNEAIIVKTGNPISILQNSGIDLSPIEKDNPKYHIFLSELLDAMNPPKEKETISSRK